MLVLFIITSAFAQSPRITMIQMTDIIWNCTYICKKKGSECDDYMNTYCESSAHNKLVLCFIIYMLVCVYVCIFIHDFRYQIYLYVKSFIFTENTVNVGGEPNNVVFYTRDVYNKCIRHKDFVEWVWANNGQICPICLVKFSKKTKYTIVKTCCGHTFHQHCIYAVIEYEGYEYKCPICRHKHFALKSACK